MLLGAFPYFYEAVVTCLFSLSFRVSEAARYLQVRQIVRIFKQWLSERCDWEHYVSLLCRWRVRLIQGLAYRTVPYQPGHSIGGPR